MYSERAEPQKDEPPEFFIPEEKFDTGDPFLVAHLTHPVLKKAGFDPLGWPGILTAELPFLYLSRDRLPTAQQEFMRLLEDGRIGPLGCLLAARVFEVELGLVEIGRTLAAAGATQLDFAGFWDDFVALGEYGEFGLQAMGGAWRDLHTALERGEDLSLQPGEATALLEVLSRVQDRTDLMAYARVGLEALWEADLRRLVLAGLERLR